MWHLAAFLNNKTVGSKIRFIGKIKPKNPRNVGGSQAWNVLFKKENAQRRRLRRKNNKIVYFPLECLSQPWNSSTKYTTTPSNIRRLRIEPESPKTFLYLLRQSSEFYLRLQSSCFFRTDFHFKLIKTCWKSSPINRRFLSFFGKNDFGSLILSVFEKKIVFGVWKKQKTIVTSFFRCIFNRQDVSW